MLTSLGFFPNAGLSKQPAFLPHSFSEVSISLHSTCRTNPQGVSLINTTGGCFKDRYKSAASLTDSVSTKNLDATVL